MPRRWKKMGYEVLRRPTNGWCDLCRKLNMPIIKYKSYDDVADWWSVKYLCLHGSSFLDSQLP